MEKTADGRCNAKGSSAEFTGLVNPHELVWQYEPGGIVFRSFRTGDRDPRVLPEEWETHFESQQLLPEKFQMKLRVSAEPVSGAQTSSGDLLLAFLSTSVLLFVTLFYGRTVADIMFALISPLALLEPLVIPIQVVLTALFLYVGGKWIVGEFTRSVKDASATIYLYDGRQRTKFHYRYAQDSPSWLESKSYWVFRYLFEWYGELTVNSSWPFIHAKVPDLERLDVWLDAKTGEVEWIVTDYHWRELWYDVDRTMHLSGMRIWIYPNFHTPLPLTIEAPPSQGGSGELMDLHIPGKHLNTAWKQYVEERRSKHPPDQIAKQARKMEQNLVVRKLSSLWWGEWRYPLGIDPRERHYEDPSIPAQPDSHFTG